MKEIEAKILEVDSAALEAQLKELGARKTFVGEIIWTVFDFPDRRFSKDEILLRLRKIGDQVELTYKKLLSADGAKVSDELQVTISDFETMKKILFAMGLREKSNYPLRKHRISYQFGSIHFEIDTLPEFPTYLEIEAPEFAAIVEYAQKLGFAVDKIKPWGTREVFAYYRKQQGYL